MFIPSPACGLPHTLTERWSLDIGWLHKAERRSARFNSGHLAAQRLIPEDCLPLTLYLCKARSAASVESAFRALLDRHASSPQL
ncbi:hypothetical protein SRHO_G00065730 [Serrasalmus rhombeus]